MAYAEGNPPTKKAFKLWVNGDPKATPPVAPRVVSLYQPGGIFDLRCPGKVTVEGPHYPKAHSWYATVEVDANGNAVPGTAK